MQSVVIRRVLVQSLRNEGASVLVRTNLFRMRIGGSMAAAPDPPRRLQAGDDAPIIGGLYAAVAKDCPCGSAAPLVFLQPWPMCAAVSEILSLLGLQIAEVLAHFHVVYIPPIVM